MKLDRPDPYAAWRSRDFRLFAAAWFLMVASKQIESVAVGWVVLARTEDPLALGLVGLVQALPVMALAMVGGQLADRFDRKRVLMASVLIGVLATAGLALVTALGLPVRFIYLLLFISSTGTALGQPSRASLVPRLVTAAVFPNAVAWSMSVFQAATLIGPAAGGVVLWLSIPAAFVVGTIGRAASILLVALLRPRPQERSGEPLTAESLLAGARFVWRTRALLGAVTLDMLAVLFGGFTYLLPIFAREILAGGGAPAGEVALGLLRSAEAVGALLMAVVFAHMPPLRRAGRTLLLAVACFGVGVLAFGMSRSFWLSLVLMAALGAVDNVSVVIRHTLVQTLTPDVMRGRVSAINNIFIVASNDLGGLESGVSARILSSVAIGLGYASSADDARAAGVVASVLLGGIGTLLAVLFASLVFPELRRVARLAAPPEEPLSRSTESPA